ncbi:MAG TPA: hypothetical protein VL359_00920 [bacterium]|nr:hypothetical protein [bacterium]
MGRRLQGKIMGGGRGQGWMGLGLAALAVALVVGAALPVSSQTRTGKGQGLTIARIQELVDAGRRAGLTQEQIEQITVQDEAGNPVNAWQFLQAALKKEQERQAELERERTKVYLTVRDIFTDLQKRDTEDLDQLRQQLPYLK